MEKQGIILRHGWFVILRQWLSTFRPWNEPPPMTTFTWGRSSVIAKVLSRKCIRKERVYARVFVCVCV